MRKTLRQIKADWKAKGLDWSYWVRGPNDERAALNGCAPEPRNGQHVIDFMEKFCCHSKGQWAGKPFKPLAFQRDKIILPLFSWLLPDGRRRYNRASIWMPKKNGKSLFASAVGLYGLAGDGESGSEVYCAAVDRQQAGIVFGESASMVEASPMLSKYLFVTRSTKTITKDNAAWFKALSADVPAKEGLNAHFVIIDELHAHKSRDLFTTLMYSGRARRNPMLFSISTAGDDKESVGGEEYDYAKGIIDGTVNDTRTFACVYEAGVNDDWESPKVWAKANPALGDIFTAEQMADDANKARYSPRKIADFKRYMLNIWVDSANPWIDMGLWDECGEPFEVEALDGNACWAGLDLSSTTDMTALVLDFQSGDRHRLVPFFWLPDDGPWRDDARYFDMYRDWAERGLLTLSPGNRIDYRQIRQTVVECSAKYDLRAVAFDPWNSRILAKMLAEEDGVPMIEMRQGTVTMNDPLKKFEADVAAGKIEHGGHPILRWMASHATVKEDVSKNIRLDKKTSKSRIDGIVASVMACGIANLQVNEAAECGAVLV